MNRRIVNSIIKYKTILSCFLLLFLSLTSLPSIQGNPFSQKNSFMIDTTKIYNQTSNWQRNSRVAFDGTNFLVVWEDIRKDEYSQISGCRLSQDGQILDKGGFTISLTESYGFQPAIAYDGMNYLVVWQSQHPFTYMAIKAARLTPSGGILDSSAIKISDTYSLGRGKPVIASSGINFLVVWTDVPSGNPGIYGARVSPQGTLLDTTPMCMSTDFNKPEHPAVAYDGTNYMVVWKDIEEFTWDSCNIYIRGVRVSTDGTILDSVPFFFVTLNDTGFLPAMYRKFIKLNPSLHFGLDNYLLVWNYRISEGQSKDLLGCRISLDGSVLDTNYFYISDIGGDQIFPSIAFDGSEFLVVWEDFRNDSFSFKPTIYSSKIDTSGIVLDTLGSCLLTDTTTKLQNPSVCFGGGEYLISYDDRRGNPFKYALDDDIYASRVDIAGNPIDSSGIPLSISTQHQRMPAVGFDGENHLVVWEDEREDDIDLYGAIVDSTGNILTPPGIFIISNADFSQTNPSVDFVNPYYLVVWEDYRYVPQPSQIFCTRVTKNGQVLDLDGIHMYDFGGDEQSFPYISNNENNFLVVWKEKWWFWEYPTILAFRIDTSGNVIGWDPIIIDTSHTDIGLPAVSFDGVNYLISYQKLNHIIGIRLNQDTTIIPPYFNISDILDYHNIEAPSITFNGTNYFVTWTRNDNPQYLFSDENIYGSRVSPEGYDLDSVDIIISKKSNDQYAPTTVSHTENFFVVWMDDRFDSIYGDCNEGIYGTCVSSEGIVLDTNGILLTPLLSDAKFASITKSTGEKVFLCYSGFTESPYGSYRIYGTFLDTLTGIDKSKKRFNFVNSLEQNFPNPFTQSTVIRYQIRETGPVGLSIYSAAGRLIKTMVNERKNPGIYTVQWNGKDSNGRVVSNGLYFYKLKTKYFSTTKKVIFIK